MDYGLGALREGGLSNPAIFLDPHLPEDKCIVIDMLAITA